MRPVALLAEGVDRNKLTEFAPLYDEVALLAEGVDRNMATASSFAFVMRSPSSRRAWIEILLMTGQPNSCKVALLAEGVDRNQDG